MKNMSKIMIFATFWNEIEWIKISMKHISQIDAEKIIVCEGNFDPKYKIHSTDGTKEYLEKLSAENKIILIKPTRLSRITHILRWFLFYGKKLGIIERMKTTVIIAKTNIYRLNQMETFNRMLTISNIKTNDWFMTFDADQFYSDKIIKLINNIDSDFNYDLITCKELTFFGDENSIYQNYELRDYNNMPHRYKHGMYFLPTRNPSIIRDNKYHIVSDISNRKKFGGFVYHYKFKSEDRLTEGYKLGNRKAIIGSQTKVYDKNDWNHPQIIKENLKIIKRIADNSPNLFNSFNKH